MKKILIIFLALVSNHTLTKNWDDYNKSCNAQEPKEEVFQDNLNYCRSNPGILTRTDEHSANCKEYACKQYADSQSANDAIGI